MMMMIGACETGAKKKIWENLLLSVSTLFTKQLTLSIFRSSCYTVPPTLSQYLPSSTPVQYLRVGKVCAFVLP